ncbi:1-deoxy-D-xylulose-5-phosphate reductoisomerase [Paracoccus sp. 1_MG-2023]|uniref:1-deoxy-D-xylulose-5-phosphate reductoisomerase n=1 Tax=unclassified Paracoccus (in: a-proteobacteria) TaxID=2688777 RepID=UPI001C0805B5|nr:MULTISPECIES: 1-deoxy-D-xylulose-5-phosphate reductoisomerase [unclassified Paracoccus (in: a-proteobacteria)]MBU2958559.1 1-deoxy-D-xylulose-5-phosphate reductoisomerase [Paracoccus sp. C2R09]MDO6667552.1 1-deoxy-D-xylulose-5-phosphate reductoisomerase [Paracoccus sp. 1_MG-2023]
MRRISIFGATGSVGANGVDLIRDAGGPEAYRTVALTGGRNIARLAEMARELQAEIAVTAHEDCLPELRDALAGSGVRAAAGSNALIEAASMPADWVLSSIVGSAGLAPGLTALAQGGTLALANKESLVCAGGLLRDTAAASGAKILPVDSEHSAVFQALGSDNLESVKEVVITASGGAFRDWPLERLAAATVAEASTHPNWAMGQRITIDSASMFNKAMEVIEAHELFGLSPDRIRVLVHPESIIHAMVTHHDGGSIAHLGAPDMRHAIGFALNWPERRPLPVPALDLAALGQLTFREPDELRWPALRLAREVMQAGGAAGAVFNAAKEQALDDFIAGRIGFTDMGPRVETTLATLSAQPGFGHAPDTLDTVLQWDRAARQEARA